MIDLDHATLDRVLPSTAGSPDWDDVLSRSGAIEHHRHRRLVVLAAAALVVAVGTASAFGVRAIVLDRGFAGLPPEGAMPSAPKTGKLALSYDGRPELSGFPSRFVPVNQVWVYADGRVIWRREGGPTGVDGVRTGFLEQRLTPEGVELLRSEIISTGLFDRDRSLLSEHGLAWGEIEVRNGDRLVSVVWCCYPFLPLTSYADRATTPTKAQAMALGRLTELLADPASSLLASAWTNRELRAYVPSKYAICFWGGPWTYSRPLDPSRILRFLPRAARNLLRGKGRTYEVFSSLSVDQASPNATCSEVRTQGARALEKIFSRAGFERDLQPGLAWTYALRAPESIGTVRMISFEPILPHGQWEAMGG